MHDAPEAVGIGCAREGARGQRQCGQNQKMLQQRALQKERRPKNNPADQ